MHPVAIIFGLVFLAFVLWDAFENVILPRHVVRKFRSVRVLSYLIWLVWAASARCIKSARRRESFLSYYGPLNLILILVVWASSLIVAFALLYWGSGSAVLALPAGALPLAGAGVLGAR